MANTSFTGQIRSFGMSNDFWRRRVERCREQNMPMRAATILRHALHQEPSSQELQLEYAYQLRELNCFESSNRECFALLARRPGCFAAFGLICQNMLSLHQMGAAMDAYTFYAQFANMYPERLPDWDEDVYDAEDVLANLVQHRGSARLERLIAQAERHLLEQDTARVKPLMDRILQFPEAEGNQKLWNDIALFALYADDPESAMTGALQALHHNGRTAIDLLPMAALLNVLGHPAAGPALMKAALWAKTSEEQYGVCTLAERMGCPQLAIGMLERLLKHMPNRMSALYNLCLMRLHQGELSAASSAIHRLREIDPDDGEVDRLFVQVTCWEEQGASPEVVRKQAQKFKYYNMTVGDEDWLVYADCLAAMEEGAPSFANRLRQNRRLRLQFIDLLRLYGDSYCDYLPELVDCMEQEEAMIWMRWLLLCGSDQKELLNTVMSLMLAAGESPPFLVHTDGHMVLRNPLEKALPRVSLLKRLLFARLKQFSHRCSTMNALPFALGVVRSLSSRQRVRMAGDPCRVWPMALHRAYAEREGLPLPALDIGYMDKRRLQALLDAGKAIRKAIRKEENEHGAY